MNIAEHYDRQDVLNRVLAALDQEYGSDADLTLEQIAAVDTLHLGGRAATVQLAAHADIRSGTHWLDVGAGPGGTARFLASTYHCDVTGLDITPAFVDLATELSRRSRTTQTRFVVGDACAMPFEDAQFDGAWMEHVQMNIADKPRLFSEISRVLKSGGKLVMYGIMQGSGKPFDRFPVPWAEHSGQSFLWSRSQLQAAIDGANMVVIDYVDKTEEAVTWLHTMESKREASGPSRLGPHLFLGPTAAEKLTNVTRGLKEGSLQVAQWLAGHR